MSVKRALVCSYYVPQPDRDSGSRRVLDHIDFLREMGWKVNFVASNGIGDARYTRVLQQRGVAVFDGPESHMDELIAAHRYDLAIFEFWPIAEYFSPLLRRLSPATRVIVDSLDLHFLRDARRILHKSKGDGSFELLDANYASQMIGEVNSYSAADAVMAVSKKEADLINDLVGDPSLAYAVPDNEDLTPSSMPYAERKGILCVGSYQHPPNIQAVEYLCKEVLPRLDPAVLAQHPVYIVGNALGETVRSYGRGFPQVRMVGWVPSVMPYFEQARISVIPLLHGAGTKRKMIQALMSGTPTVSTSIGTEGLGLRDGKHVLVRDDPDTFADSITRLLEDEDLWQHLAREGRAHIEKTHGRNAARRRFGRAIKAALAKEAKPGILPALDRDEYQERVNYQYHQQLMPHIRRAVREVVPVRATVAVVSGGNGELLRLGDRRAWHFPQDRNGMNADRPSDDAEAIAQLETLRERGVEFLLFPAPAFWWLEHYRGFEHHLEDRYRAVVDLKDICRIYQLRPSTPDGSRTPEAAIGRNEVTSATGNGAGREGFATDRTMLTGIGPVSLHSAAKSSPNGSTGPLADPEEERRVRLIAFYLPQFHPILENDAWWGEGFTEWTNVAKAQPLFPGHYQPRLPADLGFYDLRLPEIRKEQADLAREYGIHGFCYYHYWFHGKRLLERPFGEVLHSGEPDFPFCLCWANEPWSRRWDGRPRDVLQPQSYSEEDDVAHISWLMPALRDPRAIKIEGKPVFMVYQARDLPEPARTAETWRREVRKAGLEDIYLITVETGWDAGWDATQEGFDAKVLFMPQFSILRTTPRIPVPAKENLQVYDYQRAWPILADPEPVPYTRYDTVFPSWDNSARAGNDAVVVHNSTPEAYEQWLRHAVARAQQRPPDQRVVFINAWNEWAEGAHLEPDLRHGHAYLEATSRATDSLLVPAERPNVRQLHARLGTPR
jgi:glycosyltransferase involved in cell wall biosynthesis